MKFCGIKGSTVNEIQRITLLANNPGGKPFYITSDTLEPIIVDLLCKEWLSGIDSPNTSNNPAKYFLMLSERNSKTLLVRYRDSVGTTKQGFNSNYATYVFEWKAKEWHLTESHPGMIGD